MAQCDEGYRCRVCGQDVEDITVSGLYLRYVIGELDPEVLHTSPECHLACHPELAQFVVHPDFPAVHMTGPFDKRQLDADFVRQRETLVTRGWLRLRELLHTDGLSMLDYPLPEARRTDDAR